MQITLTGNRRICSRFKACLRLPNPIAVLSLQSVLVLASDGLWGHLSDEEASGIALCHAEEPQAAADALMAEVARRGGRDNASVIVASWGAGRDGR